MTPSQAVSKAASLLGNKAALAKALNVRPPTVHQWISGDRPVPPRRALQIEKITGGSVLRQHLRPDGPWDLTADGEIVGAA